VTGLGHKIEELDVENEMNREDGGVFTDLALLIA